MAAIPSVLITTDKEQTHMGRPSRAFSPKGFKIGHSVGKPGQKELHKKVIKDALNLLINPIEPGKIAEREYPEYHEP
jgi:hypothetical protein